MTKSFVKVDWNKIDKKVISNHTNYSQLAVEAGLNKSYFNKARTGVLRCNEEYFKRLCKLLNLIPSYYILTDEYMGPESEDKNMSPSEYTGLTADEQEKLNNLCNSSEEFRKALKHFTEDTKPIAIPDPIITSAANIKWLRTLETETNEILSRGILKDTNAAVHYAYYKITHSYISNSIDKMEITPTSDGTIRVRFKEENHGNCN